MMMSMMMMMMMMMMMIMLKMLTMKVLRTINLVVVKEGKHIDIVYVYSFPLQLDA